MPEAKELLLDEIAVKQQRLQIVLDARHMAGILLRRRENVSWITAGRSDRAIVMPSEKAISAVLLLQDGRRFYFTPNNEAERLAAEDFHGLGFEPVVFPWQDELPEPLVHEVAGDGALATDIPLHGFADLKIATLRWELLAAEVDRYRALCRETAQATAEVLQTLAPGVSEAEMAGRMSHALLRQSIEPTVLLMAVDERIRVFKHALPGNGMLRRFGMLNLCGRRSGLAVSVTRYVHFGAMPKELEQKFAATAHVHAALLDATRHGSNSGQCFHAAAEAYTACGFAGQEMEHHQGGAAGYLEREWLARPGGEDVPQSPQAFAWNPSITGAKTEETVLLRDGEIEPMTLDDTLPVVETEFRGTMYRSTSVLLR